MKSLIGLPSENGKNRTLRFNAHQLWFGAMHLLKSRSQ